MSVPPICIICNKEEDFQVNFGNLSRLMEYLDNYKCQKCETMETNEIIRRFINEKNGTIKKVEIAFPLKSKKELYQLLKVWKFYNRENNHSKIGGDINFKQSPHVYIEINGYVYFLNSDTNIQGVAEFLENKENNWEIIENENGNKNKITNREDKNSIKGLYLYKKN